MNPNQDNNGYGQEPGRIDLNNYVPDPNKRHELKKRLYDSGISNIPMPSVKRPIEENITMKPYSAKMNPNKIQNTSPKKKDIEKFNKNIINNLKNSYEMAAQQEAKYKGEGTAEYYKSQHIMVPPPQIFQGTLRGGKKMQPRFEVNEEGIDIGGLSTTNRILLNKQQKPGQLPSLSDYGREKMAQITSMNQSQLENMRLLQGPPSMVMAGFEGGYSLGQKNLELARSKYLVDKLTGKLSEELRGKHGKLPSLEMFDGSHKTKTDFGKMQDEEDKDAGDDDDKKEHGLQKWSDLDKFIELLLDSKSEEETVFTYLLPNSNGDPYELICGDYMATRADPQQQSQPLEKYYTLSGKGLTLYENDMPVEFISLGQWLIERDSYNHIKKLNFFKQFKKWKFMRMWKKTIKHMNRMKAQNSLEEKLFILQDHFNHHLLTHRSLMIEMEKKRFIDPCHSGNSLALEEFTDCQSKRIKDIHEEIKKVSEQSRDNIERCFTKVQSELRENIVQEIALTEERKKNNPIQSSSSMPMKKKTSNNVFERLGFPEGMTYGHRSSLRKECSRFLRFAYLVDFISMEALANIYIGSVHDMINRIRILDRDVDMEKVMNTDFDDSNQAGNVVRGLEPLFQINVQLCDEIEIPAHEVKLEKIEYYNQKTSKITEFDLLAHLELEPEKEEGEESDLGQEEEDEVQVPIFRKQVPNIQNYWLKMEPSKDEYFDCIKKTFHEGLEKIKIFERWSKHQELRPYADALEDWDEKVCDNWEDNAESNMLDPKTWINENELYGLQDNMVSEILDSAFSKMQFFLGRFQPILEIFWRNKQVDMNILVHERLSNPIDSLCNTIDLFKVYKDMFSSQIPKKAQIGLIEVDSSQAREIMQPTPEAYIKEINLFIPKIMSKRCNEQKNWLKLRIRELEAPISNVDEYVEQIEFYEKAIEVFQDVRDELGHIDQMYNVLDREEKTVKKEDRDSHSEANTMVQKLQTLLQNIESSQEQNRIVFMKQLNNEIPKLDAEISELYNKAIDKKYIDHQSEQHSILRELEEMETQFKKLDALATKYNHQQMKLDTPMTTFEHLDMAREEINNRVLLWKSMIEWQVYTEKWKQTPFGEIDAKAVAELGDKYFRNVNRLEKSLESNQVLEKLKNLVVQFKEAMPIVTAMRNERLESQHWAQIKELINKDFDVKDENFTLKSLLDLDANQFQEEIVGISTAATQEYNLQCGLDKIKATWNSQETQFKTKVSEKAGLEGETLLVEVDDIYTAIDETLAEINMILGNRYVKPLREKAEDWRRDILLMNDLMDEWLACQRTYCYLKKIFESKEIAAQLQEEVKLFNGVKKFFQNLMTNIVKQCPTPLKVVTRKTINTLSQLKKSNDELDRCQKRLDDYLETKRMFFPRFYFLSSDELIDILANAANIEIIQGHLKTLFDNIVRIELPDEQEIVAMESGEKEKVKFIKAVKKGSNIETWLTELQKAMIFTLTQLMGQGNKTYPTIDRKDFVLNHKGQIVATVAQIQWCANSERALNEIQVDPFAMQDWLDLQVTQIDQLTTLVRGNLKSLERKVIVALITTDVHARDIVEELIQNKVQSVTDFNWVKQLRYYWEIPEELADSQDAQADCYIRQVSAKLKYAYEYMGATSRLVITPLTDKCWITISNALHIKLGANPAGPAGTGKTESTKDLAKAIAIQCIVYNCSDQVDYVMMGRLFSGLIQQGCWTCLDEFNRINIEVLSVIAQQLLTIRKALIEYPKMEPDKQEFMFEDKMLKIRPEFGAHVTMNPGYAGRTELPDNLKVLFRPVAMMIPNYSLIAEIMLGAEGFGDSKVLSKKMTQLYKLSSEQLSQQDHYDFGLRAVKSVLNMAGALKRAYQTTPEDEVLIRAMKDANIPKFLKDDLPLFNAIIQDLFPSAQIQEPDYTELSEKIQQICMRKNLQKHPPFITKVIQLFETFNVRFGVMLVGQTGSGKTRCYEVLSDVFSSFRKENHDDQRFQYVKYQVLNPKAISMGEMYGEVDVVSQEWTDGLASKIMRNAAKETSEDRTWVVFDGPVDAIWIENMNTVLDDNMTLCLANGQRIKLRSQMRMLFEVQDLAVASPATVSRCGMVYMTQEEMGWKPYVASWFQWFFSEDNPTYETQIKEHINDVLIEHLKVTFEATVDIGLEWLRSNEWADEPIPTTDLQQVVSLANFLESMINAEKGFKAKTDEEKKKMLDAIFAFSFAWGIGGSLTTQSKERFDTVVRDQFKAAQIPNNFTTFDYWYDLKKEKVFKAWQTKVQEFVFDKDASFFDLMVPTQDTTKYATLLETLMMLKKPLFFTGNSGIGKSVIIENTLMNMKERDLVMPIIINMSAQTSSGRTQVSIEEKLEKKGRTAFGPPVGKKLAIYVDDINMPAVEKYGAQPPIELLRIFVDRQGLYERSAWEWKDIYDFNLIACAAPPSGGRAKITQRLTRRLHMFCLPEASQGTLTTIFLAILKGFLGTPGWQEKVRALGDSCIQSTIEIYDRIQRERRATPAKFHYAFNLRDVSKVVQGLCMTKPSSFKEEVEFTRLWVNENFRVFYDRLINEEDREWFKALILELLQRQFKYNVEYEEIFKTNKPMFGDILKLDSPQVLYEPINDTAKLMKALRNGLEDYNLSNTNKMNLVLFDDAVEHLLRIARVLRQPRGHIMLIGVGGSGKQSLIRLCTFMRQMLYKSIEITKGFNTAAFKEILKGYMKISGTKGSGISFVLTDTQIIDEAFIENLNNLLNTGTIPNLMLPEDTDEILNEMRPVAAQKKIIETNDNLLALFTNRVREYLHICLCMSPVGDTLRVRCRQFPSLINCCTLDWFAKWPQEALLYVSREFLKELPETSKEVIEGLSQMCCEIHMSVEEMAEQFFASLRRRVYTTPKSYLDLISLYLIVLEKKRAEYHQNEMRLANGLNKLENTNEQIKTLKETLTKMQPELETKNVALQKALVIVNKDKAEADAKEAVVSQEAEIVNKKAEEAKLIADDAEADLAKAKPELQAAERAVKELDKNALTEIKSMAKPPDGVVFVMKCVMILLGEKTEWKDIKLVLGDVNGLLNRLQTFNVESIKDKVWDKVRKEYITNKDFQPDVVRKVSTTAAQLSTWAIACSRYAEVVKKVAPKKARLAEVTAILNEAEGTLAIKMGELKKVKDQVAKLEADCKQMQDDKELLEQQMHTSKMRMGRAEKLVVLLKDEGIRWASTVKIIQDQKRKLTGNVFLSCACISYNGAFTGQYRERLVKKWVPSMLERKIPSSEDFSLITTLGDPVTIRNWGVCSLPSDQISVENGILTTQAERYPLCIDPQQQANKWIKQLFKNQRLKLMKFGVKDFLREMQEAVRNGKPVLIEDCEELIDPAIDPILQKSQFKTDAGIWQIKLGDTFIDFDDQFTLLLTTKLPNPHYIPEICIKVTLINFTVTFDGLQQQMLADVVKKEKPEVEAKKEELVLKMASDASTLKNLENGILKLLVEATIIQILDEDTLINTLEDSKKTSGEINERMEAAKEIELEINETRNQYMSVATRGSIIYFVIADLSGIDPMYQNSLAYIKQLFNRAIDETEEQPTVDEKLRVLIDNITKMIFVNISRGLFEKDKAIFSFLICTSIMKNDKLIDEAIWQILLRGPSIFTADEKANMLESPDYAIVGQLLWENLISADLRSQGQFKGIAQNVVDNWKEWFAWCREDDPYNTRLPGDWSDKLSNFDRLLLIKVLRLELVQTSIIDFIVKELGQFFVEAVSSAMPLVFKETNKYTPFIFVLTTGSDPMSIMNKFSIDMGMNDRMFPISLGQGQEQKAKKLIQEGKKEGQWIILQNCHLGSSFMPILEKLVIDFQDELDSMHDEFRLFCTSVPCDYFPVAVLQNSVKVTTEPPRGVKANLKRTYGQINQEFLDRCPAKPQIWRKFLFNLSFFHANLQERRKFGPLGWNIKYEFNDSDLETTFTMLHLFLTDQEEIPWDALIYVFGHINYGGRVTDDNDRECLIKTLMKYCSPHALADGFKYSPLPTYYLPEDGTIDHYRKYIDTLPLNDNPEIFGLHDNANINYNSQESIRVIDTVLSIQPRVASTGSGMTPDQIVTSKAEELLAILPPLLDKSEGVKELFVKNHQGLIPSFSTVLLQEIAKFNRLLKEIDKSLKDIKDAIQGFIVMSSVLDSMYLKLQNNQVPTNWAEVAYPSLKPLSSWFQDLIERITFFDTWLKKGNPSSYWLSGFFFPQGFMTGVLQTHSRQYKIAIDKLAFSFQYMQEEGAEEIEEKPEDGVYIYGLFMDGARFDRDQQIICDQFPTVMYDTLPVIWFKPLEDYKRDPDEYQAPLYKTSERRGVLSTTGLSTNFIEHVATPTKETPSTWTQRGAALLCMLND